ncbi:MAG TPA: hypothetical protein VIO60_03585, partial [Rectinemataceae bacterium]
MAMERSILLIPDKAKLKAQYILDRPGYDSALASFLSMVEKALSGKGIKPTLKGRIKEFDSYYAKKLRLLKKAWKDRSGPLPVNDMLAIRVICPFMGDLAAAEAALAASFVIEEIERKGAERSFREFGYESIHLLARIPEPLKSLCPHLERDVVEIQLRTILQEAWAEVEHELVYKAEFTPFDEPMRRKLAALNANLTLSDIIFQEILEYQKRLNTELGRRTDAFNKRIERAYEEGEQESGSADQAHGSGFPEPGSQADDPKAAGFVEPGEDVWNQGEQDSSEEDSRIGMRAPKPDDEASAFGSFGMDGMLLAALEAHNKADFAEAVRIYGLILDQNPEKEIASVVYKHRGMARFAQSLYREAVEDFSSCLALDPDCYKALYYRGVVKGIMEDL